MKKQLFYCGTGLPTPFSSFRWVTLVNVVSVYTITSTQDIRFPVCSCVCMCACVCGKEEGAKVQTRKGKAVRGNTPTHRSSSPSLLTPSSSLHLFNFEKRGGGTEQCDRNGGGQWWSRVAHMLAADFRIAALSLFAAPSISCCSLRNSAADGGLSSDVKARTRSTRPSDRTTT